MVRPPLRAGTGVLVYDVTMDDNRMGISSFGLKVAAIVAMACNHVANVFAAFLPLPVLLGLYALGGVTFPIMAFLLVEGYTRTSNLRRYALRLGAFALVSQVPYSLLWGAVPNVLFTLLVSLGVLAARDRIASTPLFALVAGGAMVLTIPFDWGLVGVLMVLLFHELRGRRRMAIALGAAFLVVGLPALVDLASLGPAAVSGLSAPLSPIATADPSDGIANTVFQAGVLPALWGNLLYAGVGFSIADLLISRYDGRRGLPMKWFFYGFYPLHLAVIWAVRMLIG